jgi:hypothetical protein
MLAERSQLESLEGGSSPPDQAQARHGSLPDPSKLLLIP